MTEGSLILWKKRLIGRETRSNTAKSSIKWTINFMPGGECDFLPLHLPFQGMKANEGDITHALQG